MVSKEKLENIRKKEGETRIKEELELLLNNPDTNAAYFVDYWDEDNPDPNHWKTTLLGPYCKIY